MLYKPADYISLGDYSLYTLLYFCFIYNQLYICYSGLLLPLICFHILKNDRTFLHASQSDCSIIKSYIYNIVHFCDSINIVLKESDI